MNGNENSDDIVTKSRASNTWDSLMKYLLLWCDMKFLKERVIAKGSKKKAVNTPTLSTHRHYSKACMGLFHEEEPVSLGYIQYNNTVLFLPVICLSILKIEQVI